MRQRKKSSTATADPVFDAWAASRRLDSGVVLVPGAHRPLSVPNVHLAWFLAKSCSPDFVRPSLCVCSSLICAVLCRLEPQSPPHDAHAYPQRRPQRLPGIPRILSGMSPRPSAGPKFYRIPRLSSLTRCAYTHPRRGPLTPVQLQSLIGSHRFTWTRLVYLVSTEIVRRVVEGMLDSFA